jgi:hypothetical protein
MALRILSDRVTVLNRRGQNREICNMFIVNVLQIEQVMLKQGGMESA